jgi:hypothetical protein
MSLQSAQSTQTFNDVVVFFFGLKLSDRPLNFQHVS